MWTDFNNSFTFGFVDELQKRLAGASALQTFIHQFVVLNKINNFKTFGTKIPAVISIYA